jgi:sugar lactone lactonase YvrE
MWLTRFSLNAARMALAGVALWLAGCGGGAADVPALAAEGSGLPCAAPTLTQQPADVSATMGQAASFSLVATGTSPLSYQWQRNGVSISGATSAGYAFTATVPDNGSVFRAVVTNCAGSATSNGAALTVTTSPPVLTITQQPADISVVAGTQAVFNVGGTCSAGTLGVQWQRSGGAAWADIASATTSTYSLATAIGDNGAQFRALLNCSGQSSTPSRAALLTVIAPGSVTLSLLPIVGLRDQADIASMTGIDQDPAGSFSFIAGNRIKRLSADLSTITPVAGGLYAGSADGAAADASFNQPFGLTQDAAGNLYVADSNNHTIRRIAANGTVSTLAGLAGSSGTTDGTGSAARFARPSGIALGPDGDLYVAERDSHLIRRVTAAGVVTTYAGSSSGYADGSALGAKFNSPRNVAVASNGDVLVADTSNHRIRRILRNGNAAGAVQTLAGDGSFGPASPDGIGAAAGISNPCCMVLRGNTLTVRDYYGLLRQIDLTTAAVTTLSGTRGQPFGFADGPATAARMRDVSGVTGAANGGFMLADDLGLRLVSAAGDVRTIASDYAMNITQAGVGTLAQMPFGLAVNRPQSVVVDPAGNVVISDSTARTVRRISPAGTVTLASGLVGGPNAPLDGIGSAAQWSLPGSIASDGAGVLYAADSFGVRRIGTDNATTVLAGSPAEFGAADGNASTARFNGVSGLAIGPDGNIFVSANNAIRRIDLAGNVSTYAGLIGASARVDGPLATARFQAPGTIGFAPDGALYVIDGLGGVIRRVAPDGSSVSTLPITGASTLAVDAAGTIYYGSTYGLMVQPVGGTPSILIPQGASIVLGTNPSLLNVDALAILGPKQLVVLSGSQILKVTLP